MIAQSQFKAHLNRHNSKGGIRANPSNATREKIVEPAKDACNCGILLLQVTDELDKFYEYVSDLVIEKLTF